MKPEPPAPGSVGLPPHLHADLIVFGEDWGAHPSSTGHLVRHLAEDRRIVWVNSIGMRAPRLDRSDLARVLAKLRGAAGRSRAPLKPQATPPGPIVQPLVLPMARSAPGRAINRALLARSVGGAAKRAGLYRPVLWLSLPSAVDAIDAIEHSAVVYYCGDDFSALAGVDHDAAAAMERELVARADLVLAASPLLASRFPVGKTRLLEHGVDLDLFSRPEPPALDLPKGKVAGFYGALAPWIDTGLLRDVAGLLPDWRFLFIGPVKTDVSAIAGLSNVTLLGERPHHELPGYSQHWTAGMIPFHDNAQIRASNPLKLREYLAAGRPVVATPFPAMLPYRTGIRVATTAREFADALIAAAAEGDAGTTERQKLVAGESWTARAAEASRLIDDLPA